jgi:hypothetical protein
MVSRHSRRVIGGRHGDRHAVLFGMHVAKGVLGVVIVRLTRRRSLDDDEQNDVNGDAPGAHVGARNVCGVQCQRVRRLVRQTVRVQLEDWAWAISLAN